MSDKERIDYLLLDIRELEKLIAGMRNAEIYPVSFFSQSFELTHKIMQDLHTLEVTQIQLLQKQMEEHQAILNDIPRYVTAKPEPTVPKEPLANQHEEVIQQVSQEIVQEEAIAKLIVDKSSEAPEIENAEKDTVFIESAPLQIQQPIELPQPFPEAVKPISTETIPDKVPEQQHIQKAATESQPIIVPATTVSDKIASQNISFNEILEKKNLSDFRKAFSLNDRFYFRRELFAGDETRMNRVIAELNEIHTYEDSVTYLDQELKWNIEDKAVNDFVKLLEKRFS